MEDLSAILFFFLFYPFLVSSQYLHVWQDYGLLLTFLQFFKYSRQVQNVEILWLIDGGYLEMPIPSQTSQNSFSIKIRFYKSNKLIHYTTLLHVWSPCFVWKNSYSWVSVFVFNCFTSFVPLWVTCKVSRITLAISQCEAL